MTERLRVAVLGGGRSSEHDVSLRSAASVAAALDPAQYVVLPITINHDGHWLDPSGNVLSLTPGEGGPLGCDVVFPVLHGPFGEDGSVQGLCEMLGVAYVGSGVLGSALTMDKERCKVALRGVGVDVAREVVVRVHDPRAAAYQRVKDELGFPVFVKPARLGSSIGISRVETDDQLAEALDLALAHDDKVLVEELVTGREIECGVLGCLPDLEVSIVGEIRYASAWYDYDAKYSPGGSSLVTPAELPEQATAAIREQAARAFTACECHGMARVDFFYTAAGRIVLNELNTIPGFTETSYYARLFGASGVGYAELVGRLIGLALKRFAAESELRR